jgi:CarD family transcriptional regulator
LKERGIGMFGVGDVAVYKRDVCKIIAIKKNHFNNGDYYILILLFDESLKIEVPVTNRCGNMRPLITRDEIKTLINQIPNIEPLDTENRLIEKEYRTLINSGKHSDLIKVIKTAYLRNKERENNNKKLSDKDDSYFCQAEKYLYQEL